MLSADFYLMRIAQTSSIISIGSPKKKRLFHRTWILISLLVVSPLIAVLVAVIFIVWELRLSKASLVAFCFLPSCLVTKFTLEDVDTMSHLKTAFI